MTRIHYSNAELASLREALRASVEAPDDIAGAPTEAGDESEAPVSPRAAAANRLSLLAGGYGDMCAGRGDVAGATVCRVLGDTCFYVVDPLLRPRMLDIAGRSLAALEGASAVGAWAPGVVEELQTLFAEVKPADDDAEAIARAMGMTVEEAAAFGLTGHITTVGLDEDEDDGYGREDDDEFAETEDLWEQESLETLFRRDARTLVSTTLPRALQRYWKNQTSMDALLEVRRAFHTLKGDARVTAQDCGASDLEGLAVLAEAAEDIVDDLLGDAYEGVERAPALPGGAFSLLGETQAFLLKRLDAGTALPAEDTLLVRLTAMQATARALRGSAPDGAQDGEKPAVGNLEPAASDTAPASVNHVAIDQAPMAEVRRLTLQTASSKPAADSASRANKRLVATFLSEADKLMPDIHRALARLSAVSDDESALVRARVKLHTLKGGAALAGPRAASIERLAHGCEDILELIEDYQLSGSLTIVPAIVLAGVLDAEDALQSLIDDLHDAMSARPTSGVLRSVATLPPADVEGLLGRLAEVKRRVESDDIPIATPVDAAGAVGESSDKSESTTTERLTLEFTPAVATVAATGWAEDTGLLVPFPSPQPSPVDASAAAAPLPSVQLGREAERDVDGEATPESRLQDALHALEDQQIHRDTLEQLLEEMGAQTVETRRANTRLRDLVTRVEHELAGLRLELVQTTRKSGEWDALEKEEYSAMDVLLMQLDEALADQHEAESRLRADLAEAHARVELQGETLLRAQRSLLDMSMIPLSHLEARLDHAVRSVGRRLNKKVEFALEGGDVTLDSRIAESLFNPLMLLISNAVDHGIEDRAADRTSAGKPAEGRVTVRGRVNGDGVTVSIQDDGRGIDPDRVAAVAVSKGVVDAARVATMTREERIALIWQPGFSTARGVGLVSGRGMGMKSVQDDVASLQGRVDVETDVGQGTTYTITLPRSLAMMRVQVIREGKNLVGVPIVAIANTYAVPYASIVGGPGERSVQVGPRTLAVYAAHLSSGPAGDGPNGLGILLEAEGRDGGVMVDEVVSSRYLPVRPAPAHLRRACGLLGYALGSGGAIMPILQLDAVIALASPANAGSERSLDLSGVGVRSEERPTVLVVDDSQTMRRALSQTFTRAGFRVCEAADGYEALRAIGREMPAVITLDMEMPGMDGLETLTALRRLPDGVTAPVFMVTSRQQARHRAAALAAGVTRYFTKPYDGDEMVGAARVVIAEGMAAREAAS